MTETSEAVPTRILLRLVRLPLRESTSASGVEWLPQFAFSEAIPVPFETGTSDPFPFRSLRLPGLKATPVPTALSTQSQGSPPTHLSHIYLGGDNLGRSTSLRMQCILQSVGH